MPLVGEGRWIEPGSTTNDAEEKVSELRRVRSCDRVLNEQVEWTVRLNGFQKARLVASESFSYWDCGAN